MKQSSEDRMRRAADFKRRLDEAGFGLGELQRRAGLTRNVIYNLSKGQSPTSPEMAAALERAFRHLDDES
jgi:plasmid maintenance system antidote protein VapI